MMTDDQLSGRLFLLLNSYMDERRVLDERLKYSIIRHTAGFLNLFGYDDMPEDFIDIQFIHDRIQVNLNMNYVKDGMIVI